MTASRHYLSCVNYASHSGLSDLGPHQKFSPNVCEHTGVDLLHSDPESDFDEN